MEQYFQKKWKRWGVKMNYSEILSQLLIIIAVLVAIVNIVTEVFKNIFVFKEAATINIFVTAFSIILTILAFLAYWQVKQMELTWYIIIAFVVVGFMVAYAAMFGFDKLLKYFEKVKMQ